MLSYVTFIKYIFALHSAYGVAGYPHDRTVECVADRQGEAALFSADVMSRTLAAILIERMEGSLCRADSSLSLFISPMFRVHLSVNRNTAKEPFSPPHFNGDCLNPPPPGGDRSPFPPVE